MSTPASKLLHYYDAYVTIPANTPYSEIWDIFRYYVETQEYESAFWVFSAYLINSAHTGMYSCLRTLHAHHNLSRVIFESGYSALPLDILLDTMDKFPIPSCHIARFLKYNEHKLETDIYRVMSAILDKYKFQIFVLHDRPYLPVTAAMLSLFVNREIVLCTHPKNIACVEELSKAIAVYITQAGELDPIYRVDNYVCTVFPVNPHFHGPHIDASPEFVVTCEYVKYAVSRYFNINCLMWKDSMPDVPRTYELVARRVVNTPIFCGAVPLEKITQSILSNLDENLKYVKSNTIYVNLNTYVPGSIESVTPLPVFKRLIDLGYTVYIYRWGSLPENLRKSVIKIYRDHLSGN